MLIWLFVAAVILHNLEEALLLPVWSQTAGGWVRPVGAPEFRFAVVILTLAAVMAAILAASGSPTGTYVLAGYALAMVVNTFVPHLALTIAQRRYAPGTATGLALILPAGTALLATDLQSGRLALGTFLWSGPLVTLTMLASIPILFAIGRRLSCTAA